MLNRFIAGLALAAAGLFAVALPAAATTITFEDLGSVKSGIPAYNRYAGQGVVFSNTTSYQIYTHDNSTFGAGDYSLGAAGWENISGYFTTAVNSLSLLVGDEGGDKDWATLNVYDSTNHLLASVSGSGYSWFTLSVNTVSNIARFEILETNRVAIDNLTFANKVPEPGSLALAGLALVGVAVVRRRRSQG